MKPWEFWELTWHDYHRLCAGFVHRQELEWERTRWVGALIYNANSKKSKSPQQLVPLRLDKKTKTTTAATTQEDVQRILEYHKNRLTPHGK